MTSPGGDEGGRTRDFGRITILLSCTAERNRSRFVPRTRSCDIGRPHVGRLILKNVDWSHLSRAIRTEVRNREVHQPLVSMYRWWARRPFSLVSAILDAARISAQSQISDPFSGGGTVAIEAARRGFRVYAQDLNPWASWGLKVSLTAVDPLELANAGNELLEHLRAKQAGAYASTNGTLEALHTFRVRVGKCGSCSEREWLFPYPMLTLASRAANETRAFYGCRRCGVVASHKHGSTSIKCSACGSLLERKSTPSRWFLQSSCSHCGAARTSFALQDIAWQCVLVHWVRTQDRVRFFSAAEPLPTLTNTKRDDDLPRSLLDRIPVGIETSRLLRAGFGRWCDLYPHRQLNVLLSAASTLSSMDLPLEIRDRLALCVAGAAEMPGHLCRWDRFHPKVFEALANHRYSFDGLAVEANLLGATGRGSLEHRIRGSILAARWLQQHIRARTVSYARNIHRLKQRSDAKGQITVAQGSSDRQILPTKSVSLVITDPPYFDSVQYGELAALFSAWLVPTAISPRSGRFVMSKEAVPNRRRKRDASSYRMLLTRILKECRRTLRSRGHLILTYHSTNLYAWDCLSYALAKAGFCVGALAIARTENERDHSKRGKRAFVTDLVIECVRRKKQATIIVPTIPRSSEERELLHVGYALAETRDKGYSELREAFLRRAARIRSRRIKAPSLAPSTGLKR
jgi:putative DNA methylase